MILILKPDYAYFTQNQLNTQQTLSEVMIPGKRLAFVPLVGLGILFLFVPELFKQQKTESPRSLRELTETRDK